MFPALYITGPAAVRALVNRLNSQTETERRLRATWLLALAPAQKCDPLEQMHVLLVLEQRAVQRRDQFLGVALAQRLWRNVLVEQKLEPVEQLRSGRLLFQSRRLAQGEERPHGFFHEPRLDRRIVRFDDPAHRLRVGKADVVKEAAAQESVGQLFLVVGGDDDDGPHARPYRLSGLVDVKLHLIEFEQKVVGKFDVRLVDLVDQQHWAKRRNEGVPQLAAADVVGDFGYARVAELRIAQARDGVIFIEALLGSRGRFDMPGDERGLKGGGDLRGEQRLAGAGLAFDQQRTLERDRGFNRGLQLVARHIGGGSFKTHHSSGPF